MIINLNLTQSQVRTLLQSLESSRGYYEQVPRTQVNNQRRLDLIEIIKQVREYPL